MVGGAVRDIVAGETPHDYDFTTTATPEQMMQLPVKTYPTGIDHGTITIQLGDNGFTSDNFFEVTTMRKESVNDGRHATCTWTTNLVEDLQRRDLTINAMAMDNDGNIIDPFGGKADLQEKRVRFVGDMNERIREDYLRILRWVRFAAKYADLTSREEVKEYFDGCGISDKFSLLATKNANGGYVISGERIYSELNKIMQLPNGQIVLSYLMNHHGAEILNIPANGWVSENQDITVNGMIVVIHNDAEINFKKLRERFAFSIEDRKQMQFMQKHIPFLRKASPEETKNYIMHNEKSYADIIATLKIINPMMVDECVNFWEVLSAVHFPVTGDDLIAIGFKPGKHIGDMLFVLKQQWYESGFAMTAVELIATINR